jgi:hypothetical protein
MLFFVFGSSFFGASLSMRGYWRESVINLTKLFFIWLRVFCVWLWRCHVL